MEEDREFVWEVHGVSKPVLKVPGGLPEKRKYDGLNDCLVETACEMERLGATGKLLLVLKKEEEE